MDATRQEGRDRSATLAVCTQRRGDVRNERGYARPFAGWPCSQNTANRKAAKATAGSKLNQLQYFTCRGWLSAVPLMTARLPSVPQIANVVQTRPTLKAGDATRQEGRDRSATLAVCTQRCGDTRERCISILPAEGETHSSADTPPYPIRRRYS